MAEVERIAGARVVHVPARLARLEPVVAAVVDPAEGQGRAEVAALARVIVDDVEDHLDPGVVERPDRVAHLRRVAAGQVARGGREEADRVVAPVVDEAALDEVPLVGDRLDRQQLDRRHPEAAQMRDHRGRREPADAAASILRHARVTDRQALRVRLVDHGPAPGPVEEPVEEPVEGPGRRVGEGGGDDRLRHVAGVVAPVEGEVGLRRADTEAEMRVRPPDLARQRPGVGVDQQLVGVEPVPGLGIVGAVDAIAVELPRGHVRQIAVPDLVGPFGQRDPLRLRVARGIEQAEFDPLRVSREEGEVDAGPVPRRAERMRAAGEHAAAEGCGGHGSGPPRFPRPADINASAPIPPVRPKFRIAA